jgi:UDP-2,4-diacetamido-2,4,6-trideoxy-beta-L-altropyranose hydrolase
MARVIFRTDASTEIGSGHVMRCLTLADALARSGVESQFICREHPGHLLEAIRRRGHRVTSLPAATAAVAKDTAGVPAHSAWLGVNWEQDAVETAAAIKDQSADWLVVDHYALDARWEQALRPRCTRLMVIDDLADRSHDCDLLLDQNLGRLAAAYKERVPSTCSLLTGAGYALLRPEFAAVRAASLSRRAGAPVQQLLIALGGVDKDDVTTNVLHGLRGGGLPAGSRIVVALGAQAPWRDRVRDAAASMPWPTQVRVEERDMARLMSESDLAIGAAGTMAWERCCLGLPTLTLLLAENQRQGAQALASAGAALLLPSTPPEAAHVQDAIQALLQPTTLAKMQQHAAAVTAGAGTQRVLAELGVQHAAV